MAQYQQSGRGYPQPAGYNPAGSPYATGAPQPQPQYTPQGRGTPQPYQGYPPQQQYAPGAPQPQGYPPQGYAPQPGYPQQQYAPQGRGAPQQYAPQGRGAPQPYATAPAQQYAPAPAPAPAPAGAGSDSWVQPPDSWQAQLFNQITPQEQVVMQQWFNSVDADRSGSISAQELGGILFNGKPIGVPVAAKLIRVFDRDGSGTIELREYSALHKFLMNMQNAFFAADRDRSGYIDAQEMHQAVSGAGFQLSLATIQALHAKFAIPNRGVDFPNYLFMCAHLAHLRAVFDWNDTQRTGRITLTYDALAHIATDILPS